LNQNIKEETAGAREQLREAENEAKALRTMTQRMVLTHEEMVTLDLHFRFSEGIFVITPLLLEFSRKKWF